ncbi:MAG: adenylate cyclase [Bacteroidota bacterium]|nr:adenylate cyclase [Bacteroidota bacterium]
MERDSFPSVAAVAAAAAVPTDLQRALAYYEQRVDELGGANVKADSVISSVKSDLRVKNDGFDLLADLQESIDAQMPVEEVIDKTLEAINLRLRMDRSVFLARTGDGTAFVPRFGLGFDAATLSRFSSLSFDFGAALPGKDSYLLVNKGSDAPPLVEELRERLGVPFFIALPVVIGREMAGVLLAGRYKEIKPFAPPVSQSGVNIMRAIAGFISVSWANANQFAILERMVQERTAELQAEKQHVERANVALESERHKSEILLLNVLPEEIATELKEKGAATPRFYEEATVLFTDFKGFTQIAATMSAEQVIDELGQCFNAFDDVVERFRLEKIKTIGDSYMCAAGVPVPTSHHAAHAVAAALQMLSLMLHWQHQKQAAGQPFWEVRIGLHTGPLVAGVIGTKKFAYDIWGDTVNTASRMESSSAGGRVNISAATHALVGTYFDCDYRGLVAAKGKGEVEMYFVRRLRPAYAADPAGLVANEAFFAATR